MLWYMNYISVQGEENTHLSLLQGLGTISLCLSTLAFLVPGCASSQGVRLSSWGGGAQLGSGLMLGLLAFWLTFPDSKV